MFKTIVVAVDGSDHAAKAVDVAADLARKYGSKLIALTVYKHASGIESTHSLIRTERTDGALPSPDAALRELARGVAEAAAARARERGAADVECVVKRGPPSRTIVDYAEQRRADAIVMGNRGLGDIGGFLLGSVSHKVANLSACTCITVK